MQLSPLFIVLVGVSVQTVSAQLNLWAQRAGLKYFGSATDSPGERERAGYEAVYPEYNAIFDNIKEFGQTTPTNGMKWYYTEPSLGVYNYTEGEIVSKIAEDTGKILRCHTLVYWAAFPLEYYYMTWTKENLTEAITDHITNVAGHWKGRCYAWDVVNEALNDDGTYMDSWLYQVLGEEFIKLAFRVAAKVDPDAKLYYNDAGLEVSGPKADGALRIIRMLQAEGLRIDGIGLQSHLTAGEAASIDEYITQMETFGKADVEVALTELDVGLVPPMNSTNLVWQQEAYRNIVGACVQTSACIGITLWDFYDPFSWLPHYENLTNGTLWFSNFSHHPAYRSVIETLKNGTRQ